MPIYAPQLARIEGDLDAIGNKEFGADFPFPKLEFIGGNFIIAYTGMRIFPQTILNVEGNVVISDQEPACLVDDLKRAKTEGVIKGAILCILTP